MIKTARQFGEMIRAAREIQRITQRDLAMVANTGERFVVDLESGKETCHLGKALAVANALGIRLVDEAQATPRPGKHSLPDVPPR
jgi:HTH-type transcriptional regulator / antitoxin HipB